MSYILRSGKKKRIIRAIAIHHSQSSLYLAGRQSFDAALRDIAVTHKRKGFGNIGYHGVIGKDGKNHWTRSPFEPGVHAPGRNHDTLAFCFLGDFRTQKPTEKQVVFLRQLLNGILPELAGMSVDYAEEEADWMPMVLGHLDLMARRWRLPSGDWSEPRLNYTECPGKLLDFVRE